MIYTITLNPSIDYYAESDGYRTGRINRTKAELVLPGGKGINVSIVLNNLGQKNRAYGFTAGFTGNEIDRLLTGMNVEHEFIRVEGGMSRINVKVKSAVSTINGEEQVYEETDLNGMGPDISDDDMSRLKEKLGELKEGDVLVLSGGKAGSMSELVYAELIEAVDNEKIRVVADASGKLLKETLKYHPFLVKPNDEELAHMYGESADSKEDVIRLAGKMQAEGAVNVLVSRGSSGAVLLTEAGEVFIADAPKGKVVSTIGAGDSMVAGFLDGYLRTGDYEYALKEGICAGSASAFSEGLADAKTVHELMINICP